MAAPILQDRPITTREALIPFAMAGVNMLAPTLAAARNITPQILMWSIGLLLCGLPASLYFRQRRYHYIALNLIVMLPLLILTWALTHSLPGLQIDWSSPWDSMLSHDGPEQLEGLLNIFVLLAAGRAFVLVSSREMLHTPIPGISIFLLAVITGLMVEKGTSHFTLFYLLLFVLSSLYLFGQDHHQRWFSAYFPLRMQRHLVLTTLLFSVLIFPPVVFLGTLAKPFNMRDLSQSARSRPLPTFHLPSFFGEDFGVSFENSIDIGGAGWPDGNKQPIMEVKVGKDAPQNLLWRANSYATYNAGKWNMDFDTAESLEKPDIEDDLAIIHPDANNSDPGIKEALKEIPSLREEAPSHDSKIYVQQTITYKAHSIGKLIPVYGAAHIFSLKATQSQLISNISVLPGS